MRWFMFLIIVSCYGCATTQSTLYDELGGRKKIAEVVDNFIVEIEFNPVMYEYFKESDIDRFREKLNEHLCVLAGGPCQYSGDTMEQVHSGMNISEGDFNLGVDLFINAMDRANIPHRLQNRLIREMAPLRKEMIYL